MSTIIKVLKDKLGNTILPRTRSTAVTMLDDRTLDVSMGDLNNLTTTDKGSVVGAVNELDANINLVQSGGLAGAFANMPYVGTAPIVESGSNANGNYVKYADGTMICYHHFTVNITGWAWTAAGNVYSKSVALPDFPIAFISPPEIDRYLNTFGGTIMWGGGGSTIAPTTINGGNIYIFATNNVAPTGINVGYFAIGKWK